MPLAGLKQPVEILRDRWGVPHIYAKTAEDLFFAQGYITARDRLFQLDLWRRVGTGKLAEVLGPSFVPRDRIAQLVRYRGNWDEEWKSYSPDAQRIVESFVLGINAYIRSLHGERPPEFQRAGYDPSLWTPEDVVSRVAGLLMTNNAVQEVTRALQIQQSNIATVQRLSPPDPFIPLTVPTGLNLADLTPAIIKDYVDAVGPILFPGQQGSNNWVIDGTLSKTGKPLLANDPHRPVSLPSLRKTVHLVGPGWNVIGAGEPALPGVALGHNENIAFGFTIVGIDQQDLYVEKVNPENPAQYMSRGAWKNFEVEKREIQVRGAGTQSIELKYTEHGPVLYEDAKLHRAYALKWVGAEAGGAGYLAALALVRAKNWQEFRTAAEHYRVPSENLVYADTKGNIGWIAGGQAPLRKGWSGLLPVPGDQGKYEWSGYQSISENPTEYNPSRHYIATANHNILPKGYNKVLSYTWASPTRYQRIVELLTSGKKFDVQDFAQIQQDTVSLPAREFIQYLKTWHPHQEDEARYVKEMLAWDANLGMDSRPALIYEVWMARLTAAIFSPLGPTARYDPQVLMRELRAHRDQHKLVENSLKEAITYIKKTLGDDESKWTWGEVHVIPFKHPLRVPSYDLPSVARPGDGYTVNATGGGPNFTQAHGASYRQILDVEDWDRSVMTNVPGESGNPGDRHYADLVQGWSTGNYHPMPFSRKAVEAAAEERILLTPAP